jgi:monofunctional biosynthetic peptidoglycan transglycosylase
MPRPPKSRSGRNSGKPSRSNSRKNRLRFLLRLRLLRLIRLLVLFFLASSSAAVLFFRFVPPPLTPLMAVRCLQQAVHGRAPSLHKDWQPMERISPRLAEAVIASEDQLFFDHHGFDWESIRSAFSINGEGKRKVGASTITQQTAKNLFLWPDRSWTRKGLEAYFTLLLELFWSKQRILEVYLNIIETGDGAYGAEAAARRYFQVSAADLDAGQAALLAAILPNPRVWSPVNPSAYLRRRQTWILRQMDHLGPLPGGLSRGGPRAPASATPAPTSGNPASKAGSARPEDTSALPAAPAGPPPAPESPLPAAPAPDAESAPDAPPFKVEPDTAEPVPPTP